jgi:hypothetical protein
MGKCSSQVMKMNIKVLEKYWQCDKDLQPGGLANTIPRISYH